jgi:hypothetical protein
MVAPDQSAKKPGFTFPVRIRVLETIQADGSPPPSPPAGLDQGRRCRRRRRRHRRSSEVEPPAAGIGARLSVHASLGPTSINVEPPTPRRPTRRRAKLMRTSQKPLLTPPRPPHQFPKRQRIQAWRTTVAEAWPRKIFADKLPRGKPSPLSRVHAKMKKYKKV